MSHMWLCFSDSHSELNTSTQRCVWSKGKVPHFRCHLFALSKGKLIWNWKGTLNHEDSWSGLWCNYWEIQSSSGIKASVCTNATSLVSDMNNCGCSDSGSWSHILPSVHTCHAMLLETLWNLSFLNIFHRWLNSPQLYHSKKSNVGHSQKVFQSPVLTGRLSKGKEVHWQTHTHTQPERERERERERESNRIFCHYGYWQQILISLCHVVLILGSVVVVLSRQNLLFEVNLHKNHRIFWINVTSVDIKNFIPSVEVSFLYKMCF